MKFGQKSTVSSRMKSVEDRYGKTLGASKGSPAPTKVKITPTGNPFKGKIGIKIVKKF